MKVVENSPENPRNCTISKKFLGGACPQTPLAEARDMHIQNLRNFKVGPPPLRNPAYAPGYNNNNSLFQTFVHIHNKYNYKKYIHTIKK